MTNQETLQALCQQPAAVKWFKGLFHTGHLEITDAGEKFTVRHDGNSLRVTTGFEGERPNFVVPLESANIRNLSSFFDDELIDEREQYRIVKFMLKPCLRAALDMPILNNKAFRAVVKVDTHWQEALLDPDGREDEQLTVVCVNDQWLIVPGYHGRPQRRLVLTPAQVLEYQRRVFEANENNSLPGWLSLGKWYLQWRDTVSVPV
jgi:hypothetical protein